MTSFSGLCESLGCKLTNYRNRWSAYNPKINRGIFTIWADRLDGKRLNYLFNEALRTDQRPGARELCEHLDAIVGRGGDAFGIYCVAKDADVRPRVRKSFDDKRLLKLRITSVNDGFVAHVIGEVDVDELVRNKGTPALRRVSDAIDDLPDDPPGNRVPQRGKGTMSFIRRDDAIRKRVLKRAKGKCEHCGELGFETGDGMRYLEAHHIVGLAKNGPDTMENVIALCANHHREAHYGLYTEKFEVELATRLKFLRSKR